VRDARPLPPVVTLGPRFASHQQTVIHKVNLISTTMTEPSPVDPKDRRRILQVNYDFIYLFVSPFVHHDKSTDFVFKFETYRL
jgi:hypothetical protein